MSTIETLSQEEKNKIVETVNTELVSIASEEERTGQTINIPKGSQLVQVMAMELIRCKRAISQLLPEMSKRDIHRSVLGFLDLPTEGIPVYLKSEQSKMLYALGQRAINARFVIVKHHTDELIKEAKLKKQQQESEASNGAAEATTGQEAK